MAGPIVHKHFFKECLEQIDLKLPKNYNNLNIYAQGHDLLLYIEIWNFVKNRNLSLILSNFNFREFIYNYLYNISEYEDAYKDKDLKLFLYGYISHHILDSYFHPFIMQYAVDYLPVAGKPWIHGKIETLYDTKFILEKDNKKIKDYKIYKDFNYSEAKNLTSYIGKTVYDTYHLYGCGQKFDKAFKSIATYMHLYRYDPHNLKQKFAKLTEKIVNLGAGDFFYDVKKLDELNDYMNNEHNTWLNPFTNQTSNDSFQEIYQKSLEMTVNIIGQIEEDIQKNKLLSQKQVNKIIPDRSAITGDKCNKSLNYIKYRRY